MAIFIQKKLGKRNRPTTINLSKSLLNFSRTLPYIAIIEWWNRIGPFGKSKDLFLYIRFNVMFVFDFALPRTSNRWRFSRFRFHEKQFFNFFQMNRLIWIMVQLVAIVASAIIIAKAWDIYTTNPLLTALYDTLFPIIRVPFPAISICNNNRISLRAAKLFAKELWVHLMLCVQFTCVRV